MKSCKLSYCNVSVVVTFERFVGKGLQENSFSLKLHSASNNNNKSAPHHRYFPELYPLSEKL